jgi:hypothetical protein
VVPVLRKSDAKALDTLWKIDDPERFKAILLNESLAKFRNYRLVICKNQTIWIHAVSKHADRSLATVLTDTFSSYIEMVESVFVPKGKILAPGLSSERLHKIIGGKLSDFIVIEKDGDSLLPVIIEKQDWSEVEDFITLQAETAAKKAEALKPGWKFEFKDLKKKKEIVQIEVKTTVFEKIKAKSEEGQVGAGAGSGKKSKNRKKTIDLSNVPELGKSALSELRLELEQIDRQLLQNVADHQLWKQRYMVCLRMRLRNSALASLMLSAVLAKDDKLLGECIHELAAIRPEFEAMNQENISEVEKGRLLADIRRESVNCEFYYGLLMAYSAKFNDSDIFFQAVEAMKNAFPGEKRDFYGFNEIRVASGGGMNVENRVELLTENDLPRIKVNVNKFILQVGCAPNIHCIALARKQLKRILSFHLSESVANDLAPLIDPFNHGFYNYNRSANEETPKNNLVKSFWDKIDRWPESCEDKRLRPAVSRWLNLLVMDKIKETPLRDFFTGDLYKPPFSFIKKEEERPSGLLRIPWIKELSEDQYPSESDGRPIARAIYYRFSSNSADWKDYFVKALKSKEIQAIAKSQRLLLLMVSEFGPHPAFAEYIIEPKISPTAGTTTDIYDLTMYCDMYRLCLAYKKPIDEQRLFNMLINRIPRPPDGWVAFKNSAEWIILCLLLTSSPVRRFQLDNLIGRSMRWMNEGLKANNSDMVAEALTVLCFLSIGILADLVPEKLELHQLLEKRKVIWMEHAFAKAAAGVKAFEQWQQDCWF